MLTAHDKKELTRLITCLRNVTECTISDFESEDDELALSSSACHFAHDLAGTLETNFRAFEEALKN